MDLNLTPVMSTRALHEDLVMVEEPIPYSERVGRSKLSVVGDGTLFAQSIVWTAMSYNPVRPLGLIGLLALLVAGIIGIGLVAARLSGIDYITATGAFVLFTGLVLAVAGISILALGISFNYFVALFHGSPIRQGIFGRPVTNMHLADHFGWIGLGAFVLGTMLGIFSLALGTSGWTLIQVWVYYLIAASLALVGIQLIIGWIQIQVLETLSMRESLVADDLLGKETLASDSGEGAILRPNVASNPA